MSPIVLSGTRGVSLIRATANQSQARPLQKKGKRKEESRTRRPNSLFSSGIACEVEASWDFPRSIFRHDVIGACLRFILVYSKTRAKERERVLCHAAYNCHIPL